MHVLLNWTCLHAAEIGSCVEIDRTTRASAMSPSWTCLEIMDGRDKPAMTAVGRKRTLVFEDFEASERPLSGKADIRWPRLGQIG